MALPSAALSKTLQSITITKIGELEKQRNAFERRKNELLAIVEQAGNDHRERAHRLLEAVKEFDPSSEHEASIWNIHHCLYQSYYDPSTPKATLETIENQLRSKIDAQSRRLSLADLYSRLLTEWLVSSASNDGGPTPAMEEITNLEASFEVVERDRLQQLREKFEAVVFTPLETDEDEIDNYLSDLLATDTGTRGLERLRREVREHGEAAFKKTDPFDRISIKWCIKGLLKEDLLREDKRVILQDFLQDEVALGEICDVLNMKYKDLKNWSWDAGDEGMPVEPRRQLNGKYRVMMDEDVLQAMLVHHIGVTWSVSLKRTLGSVVRHTSIWEHGMKVPQDEVDKSRYFLGGYRTYQPSEISVAAHRQETYINDYFMTQLPSSVYEGSGGYDGDDDDGDGDGDEDDANRKSAKGIKQQLLRQLATEVHLRRTLDGEVAIVQSDLQWFGTSLSHSTIFAMIRFIGVPEEWISFFKKFLEAPLNMSPVSPEPKSAARVQIRKRGVPMAHALEKFFGELILFFMDLAVTQQADMLLYRFHDDLWLVGEPEKCGLAWKTMEEFSAVMGLEFNRKKTGSVYLTRQDEDKDTNIAAMLPKGPVSVGFLKLDAKTGDWLINQEEVNAHIKQLQKQLSSCTSVLSWVQTWNSCIGRFFGHTFGEPANCFGEEHVNSILNTHKRMQEILFDGKDGRGSTVTEHVKGLIAKKFNVTDVPDAFIYMPEQLGGLGLRNPFVTLFMVRNYLKKDPREVMSKFLVEDLERYSEAKKEFEELSEQSRRRRFLEIWPKDLETVPDFPNDDRDTFMSFDDYKKWRESTNQHLLKAYKELMQVPSKKEIKYTLQVEEALKKLAFTQPELAPDKLDAEQKWIIQFHSTELFERCDGLSIVDKSLLPLGIMMMLKTRKVTWQMVL